MAFKNYRELTEGIAAAGQSWSDADKELAQKDINYGNSIFTLKKNWQDAAARGDTTAAQDIHDRTEIFRRQYGGYTGGADGSGYIKDTTYFNYDDPYKGTLNTLAQQLTGYGTFQNPYQQQTQDVLGQYLNRDPFSYDPDTDPIWGQYQKTYLREGQRAREDTLGNYAAATGGQTSTAATNAASQAQDYYNAQMADKVPELYKLAYDMWLNEGDQYASQLDTLRGLGSDALNEWNANRGLLNDQLSAVRGLSGDFYDRAYDKWKSDYSVNRDRISDTRYEDETSYSRSQSEKQQALAQAVEWLKMGVMPDSGVIETAGLTPQEAEAYRSAVLAQAVSAIKGSSGRSGSGSSSGSSSSSSKGLRDYNGLFQAAAQDRSPQNFIETHYKDFGFDSKSGLYAAYQKEYSGRGSTNTIAGLQDGLRFAKTNADKRKLIGSACEDGWISKGQANQIMKQLGLDPLYT